MTLCSLSSLLTYYIGYQSLVYCSLVKPTPYSGPLFPPSSLGSIGPVGHPSFLFGVHALPASIGHSKWQRSETETRAFLAKANPKGVPITWTDLGPITRTDRGYTDIVLT
jgi:hypothetical protein